MIRPWNHGVVLERHLGIEAISGVLNKEKDETEKFSAIEKSLHEGIL